MPVGQLQAAVAAEVVAAAVVVIAAVVLGAGQASAQQRTYPVPPVLHTVDELTSAGLPKACSWPPLVLPQGDDVQISSKS